MDKDTFFFRIQHEIIEENEAYEDLKKIKKKKKNIALYDEKIGVGKTLNSFIKGKNDKNGKVKIGS